jgi:hypothetical protein
MKTGIHCLTPAFASCSWEHSRARFILLLLLSLTGCQDSLTPLNTGPSGNRAPVITPLSPQTIFEGEILSIQINASDPDDHTLYLEVEGLPDGAEFDPVLGVIEWIPGFGVVAQTEERAIFSDIIIQADDLYLSDSTTLTITVYNTNRPPIFLSLDGVDLTSISMEMDPASTQHFQFQAVDPDGDQFTLYLNDAPDYVELDDLSLNFSPQPGDSDHTDLFTLVADDSLDTTDLPVSSQVGSAAFLIPAPTGLSQSDLIGEVDAGEASTSNDWIFSTDMHHGDIGSLRLEVEVTPLNAPVGEEQGAISDPVEAGLIPSVEMTVLERGLDYTWRARFLSDELGPGDYTDFGGNDPSSPDFTVLEVPETYLDATPHDPSPIDVIFTFYSDSAIDFECRFDEGAFSSCVSPLGSTVRPAGLHTFDVRAVSYPDEVPDPTPASHTWEVLEIDCPPTLSFVGTTPTTVGCPSCPCNNVSVTYTFISSQDHLPEAGIIFECRLTKAGEVMGVLSSCTSPKTYTGLSTGNYTFEVQATNTVGCTSDSETDSFSAQSIEVPDLCL